MSDKDFLDSRRAMRDITATKRQIQPAAKCPVERLQHHPTDPKLSRRVPCRGLKGHAHRHEFEPVPKAEPVAAKRPRCDTSVHPMLTLALGRCRCGFTGCAPCLKRHIGGDACPYETFQPF